MLVVKFKRTLILTFFFILFISLTLPHKAKCACPDWINLETLPLCPEEGGAVLPDTFPAMAHIVSDFPILDRKKGNFHYDLPPHLAKSAIGSRFSTEFILKTLEGAGDTLPLLFMPVRKSTFEKAQQAIRMHFQKKMRLSHNDYQRKRLRALKRRWLESLVFVPMRSVTWQQDYFKTFFNPNTGAPTLRFIQKAGVEASEFEPLRKAMEQACPKIQSGPDFIQNSADSFHFGGNILGLPGGLVLHGTQKSEFSNQYSSDLSDPSQEISVDTSWLGVGHVDEILGIAPNQNQKSPCNFSITIASPRKGLELLSKSENKNAPFFSDPYSNSNIQKIFPFKKLMKFALETVQEKTPQALTNAKAFQLIIDSPHLRVLNELIQERLDEIRATVKGALEKKLPQCAPIPFIEVPDLYVAEEKLKGLPTFQAREEVPEFLHAESILDDLETRLLSLRKVDKNCSTPEFKTVFDEWLAALKVLDRLKQFQLKPALDSFQRIRAGSILPSPANLVVVSDENLLFPKTHNPTFDAYIQGQFRLLGVQATPLDTLAYAHAGEGNLHCATQSIRVCRPR